MASGKHSSQHAVSSQQPAASDERRANSQQQPRITSEQLNSPTAEQPNSRNSQQSSKAAEHELINSAQQKCVRARCVCRAVCLSYRVSFPCVRVCHVALFGLCWQGKVNIRQHASSDSVDTFEHACVHFSFSIFSLCLLLPPLNPCPCGSGNARRATEAFTWTCSCALVQSITALPAAVALD